LKAVEAGAEGEDLGNELNNEKDDEQNLVGVPGGGEGYGVPAEE
jgi:hypothetical protein